MIMGHDHPRLSPQPSAPALTTQHEQATCKSIKARKKWRTVPPFDLPSEHVPLFLFNVYSCNGSGKLQKGHQEERKTLTENGHKKVCM
jgi:hypothetical protein